MIFKLIYFLRSDGKSSNDFMVDKGSILQSSNHPISQSTNQKQINNLPIDLSQPIDQSRLKTKIKNNLSIYRLIDLPIKFKSFNTNFGLS